MFICMGSIINALAIVVGGLIGIAVGRFLTEHYQETIIKIVGFGVVMMAIGSTLSQMLVINVSGSADAYQVTINTQGTIMMIVSLAGGALLGELLNLEKGFERFGTFLRDKTGNSKDNQFIDAFLTSSLTVCIGAMAVIGAIEEGINADASILISKAIIDLIIILVMASSMGKGCMFASVPVLIWQGGITLLSKLIAPIMTDVAVSNLSLVGNVLILCVGVNIIWPKTIRVANVLPAIIIAVVWALVG